LDKRLWLEHPTASQIARVARVTSVKPRSGSRVFLSFAHEDSGLAQIIRDRLAASEIKTVNWEHVTGATGAWQPQRELIRSSDVLVVLLSPASSTNTGVAEEVEAALSSDLDRRGIDVIPVLAAPTTLPPALSAQVAIDLTDDISSGLEQLVAQIEATSRADFSTLKPPQFERLVADLLRDVGFNVEENLYPSEGAVDMRATYERVDPFGCKETEVWLVEAKLYSHQRVSVPAIQRLAGVVALATADGTRGLLVTNGQLTSVAREYVTSLERRSHVRLRVIDGVELRRLLREHLAVAARYFGPAGPHPEHDADT